MSAKRRVVLVQLPIPPLTPAPVRGNVPLAAAYLHLYARQQGLERSYEFEIVPAAEANALGDRALVSALAARDPWLVGFTCYVWNIDRTLWVARELKRLRPEVRIVLGGPEVTADNAWMLETPDYDWAVIGEGEQTFAELLARLDGRPRRSLALLGDDIPGLFARGDAQAPPRREPLPDITALGSPYLAGILDAAEERMMLLETTRGCVFNCKFCYYPKSYDKQYFASAELVRASLAHAADRGAEELFLLDPTLNQRKDFPELLELIAAGNPGGRFRCFGELRAEGITERTAALLKRANFTEVEVGLQSVDPDAMKLMDRNNNLRAFERGVRAMRAAGIAVKVDLIIGLPGDTAESVRHGLRYLGDGGLFDDLQVFNLAVLPGTAFRHEAAELGLTFQPRPPYYVLKTQLLTRIELFDLIREAQTMFGLEFDAAPPPVLDVPPGLGLWRVDLDSDARPDPPPDGERRQAFTLWLTSEDFDRRRTVAAGLIREVLADNPFTTLQVVLDCRDRLPAAATFADLTAACQERPTYLDRYYALQPGGPVGAKRLVVVPAGDAPPVWVDEVTANWATVAWRGPVGDEALGPNEFAVQG